MKVFISSVIGGFEEFREAAAKAIASLGHVSIRAEDYSARPDTPQRTCLQGVRDSDAVVLLLGERYGVKQRSGLSATHEEYREACETKPVLVFIQRDVNMEPNQMEFKQEVQDWSSGHYTEQFQTSDELRDYITRSLHEFELASSGAARSEDELRSALSSLLGHEGGNQPSLVVGVVSGQSTQVLRPSELESVHLRDTLMQLALFGANKVLDSTQGTNSVVTDDSLDLMQSDRSVKVWSDGSIRVAVPATTGSEGTFGGLSTLIEEDIHDTVKRMLLFSSEVLENLDATGRVSTVATGVALCHAGYMPWKSRREFEQSPSSAMMGTGDNNIQAFLRPMTRNRASLKHNADRLAEDFTVMLRRKIKP